MNNQVEGCKQPITVLHIIGGLQKGGGAEEMLFRLVLENKLNRHVIMSLQDEGYYGAELEKRGFQVITVGLNRSPTSIFKMLSMVLLIRKTSPDTVQTWMYYSDLIGGFCARVAGVRNVVWGIHHSTMDPEGSSMSIKIFQKLCAVFSKLLPIKIISCSHVGARAHVECGYMSEKMKVVPNGYDLIEFVSDKKTDFSKESSSSTVQALSTQYKFSKDTVCLGMVARFDPQKDHENLLRALSALRDLGHNNWKCFLFGKGIDDNTKLNELIIKYGLGEKIVTFGLSIAIAEHLQQLDLNILSSKFGEAFPNVLNEAMACQVPCVTTDVGDSGLIVGDCGWVVPPSDPQALAMAIFDAITEMQTEPEKWADRCNRSRQRIVDNFSIKIMSDSYESVWRDVG